MSDKTTIAWTDASFNPWWGCVKVSSGCDNCYAERDAKRYASGQVLWGVGSDRRTFSEKHWNDPVKWNRKAEAAGVRMRVFCASMADVFDNHPTAEALRPRLWELIRATPALDWQLLTKRVGNIRERLPDDWGNGYQNVLLGISVVDQVEADRDVPKLLRIPARRRWLSIEPQLGPVDLSGFLYWQTCSTCGDFQWIPGVCLSCKSRVSRRGLHWVIVGGESGYQVRRFDVNWARSLRDQCRAAGVAVFVKQLGARPVRPAPGGYIAPDGTQYAYIRLEDRAGRDMAEWPSDLRVRDFPQ